MNLRYLRIMKPFDKMIINEYTSILLLFNMCVLFHVYVCTI